MQRPSDAASPAAGVPHLREILPRSVDRDRRGDHGEFPKPRSSREPRQSPIPMSTSIMSSTRLVSRRSFLRGAAAASALSLPGLLRAQSQTTLRFVPVIDLTFVDPVYSTAQVSRNHAFMVYDTLYGLNSALEVSPQLLSGHVVSGDDRPADLSLRDGVR